METTSYIKNKNKLKNAVQFIGQLKNWKVIEANGLNKWIIYEKGELLARIEYELTPENLLLKISTPVLDNVSISDEIMVRPLLLEKNIREILKSDRLVLIDDIFYLYKNVKIDIKKQNFKAHLLNILSEIITSVDIISVNVEIKINNFMQTRLN